MTESPSNSQTTKHVTTTSSSSGGAVLEIPIEIVTEEEMAQMAQIEAALMATRSSLSSSALIPAISSPSRSSVFQINARSIQSITVLSKRRLSPGAQPDVEDSGGLRITQTKKNRAAESLFSRFRKTRGLSVTDFTGAVCLLLGLVCFCWILKF